MCILLTRLLQFLQGYSETLQVFLSRSEHVHDDGCNTQIIFVSRLCSIHSVNFGSISTQAYRNWVSCEHNSSYYFTRSFFETLQVFLFQGLKMCIRCSCKPQFVFVTFFAV